MVSFKVKVFVSLIMVACGVLLTGIIQNIAAYIQEITSTLRLGINDGFSIGVASCIIALVLVGICWVSYHYFKKIWFIVIVLLSFVVSIILENIFLFKADWAALLIGSLIPCIVLLIIYGVVTHESNGGSSESSRNTPKKFSKYDTCNGCEYRGDDGSCTSYGTTLEKGYRDGVYEGSNGVTYTLNYNNELEGSDGSIYRKSGYNEDWEKRN